MELLTGAGHPSKRLKGEVGQHYKDDDTGDIWECISANQYSRIHHQLMGGYIWKKMTTGDHIEACNVASGSSGPTEVVILPETVATHDGGDDPKYIITTPPSAIPAAGTSVNVTYNGVAYTCPVVYQQDEGYDVYAMGNLEILGETGGNSDAPFAVILVPAGADGVYGMCIVIDAPQGVTLSIVQIGGKASGSDSDILTVKCVSSTSFIDKTTTISGADKSFSEVVAAYTSGKLVRFIAQYRSASSNCDFVGEVCYAGYDNGAVNVLTIEFPMNIYANEKHRFGFNTEGFTYVN